MDFRVWLEDVSVESIKEKAKWFRKEAEDYGKDLKKTHDRTNNVELGTAYQLYWTCDVLMLFLHKPKHKNTNAFYQEFIDSYTKLIKINPQTPELKKLINEFHDFVHNVLQPYLIKATGAKAGEVDWRPPAMTGDDYYASQ